MHTIVREHFETLRELSVDPDDARSGLPEFVVPPRYLPDPVCVDYRAIGL